MPFFIVDNRVGIESINPVMFTRKMNQQNDEIVPKLIKPMESGSRRWYKNVCLIV